MHILFKKNTGKASSLFIVICTALVCLVIFCVYQFGTFKSSQNKLEQAEFEQTYGKPAGSSPNYQSLQAKIQKDKIDNEINQEKLKDEWIVRFDSVIQAQNLSRLEQTVTDLKQASLDQEYQIQILQELVTKAVLNHDVEVLNSLLVAGSPLVRCEIHLREGDKLLKYALENEDIKSFETLVQANCMKGSSAAKNNLITYVVKSPEPWRSNLFKALNSSLELQVSVVKEMLTVNDQTGIIEYLSQDLISKDFIVGSSTLLSYSILNDKSLLTEKLIEMGAERKGKSSIYNNAFLVALKKQNLTLVDQLASTYPEDLNDEDLIRIISETTTDEFSHQVTKILFENQPNIIHMDYVSKNLLRHAVMKGRYEQVKYLLEKGLNPNKFIGRQTILSLAIEKTPASSQDMINILRKHGAIEDTLELVRKERGISNTTECNYAETETVDPKIFTTAYNLLEQQPKDDGVSTWPQIQLCEVSIVYCKDQGLGVDACMVSVPSCEQVSSGACCPADVKKNYFEGRCAGLGVTETIYWMDVFSSAYGVPINFSH